jgi:Uma2 family endonuclease
VLRGSAAQIGRLGATGLYLFGSAARIRGPAWRADREIGLLISLDEKFNPEPDVTVIDTAVEMGQLYAERFYFVAEVLSGSDKPWVLEAKMRYYQQHEPCLAVLFVSQEKISADVFARANGWSKVAWSDPVTRVDVPVIGDIGALSDLYRYTPLALQPK